MGLLDRVGRKLEGSKLARIIRQEPAATTALEYCIQESSKYHITTVSHKTRSYLRIKYTDYNSVASTRAHNHPPPSIFVRLPVTANCVL
ncbi:hypothetical protein RI367_005117 [Sorochytrium milnesiophthora]